MLKVNDIVHFKSSGLTRFSKLNRMRSGIYIEIEEIGFIATVINGVVTLIPFLQFADAYSYISSRANWIENPYLDIISRIGMKYKGSGVFVAEILGYGNFEVMNSKGVLEYCINKEWLLA